MLLSNSHSWRTVPFSPPDNSWSLRTRKGTICWSEIALSLCSLPRGCLLCSPLHQSTLCVPTGAYVVFVRQLHKLRARQIKDLPVPKCLTAGGCLENDGCKCCCWLGSLVWVQGDIQRGICAQAVPEVRLTWASSMSSSRCPRLSHIPGPQSRPPPTAVHTVGSVGMSLLITKPPPSPPCFFSNHSIKEMCAPKPYPACFPYT